MPPVHTLLQLAALVCSQNSTIPLFLFCWYFFFNQWAALHCFSIKAIFLTTSCFLTLYSTMPPHCDPSPQPLGTQKHRPKHPFPPQVRQKHCRLWLFAGYWDLLKPWNSCSGEKGNQKSENSPSHRSPMPGTPNHGCKHCLPTPPALNKAWDCLLTPTPSVKTTVLHSSEVNRFPFGDVFKWFSCYVCPHP